MDEGPGSPPQDCIRWQFLAGSTWNDYPPHVMRRLNKKDIVRYCVRRKSGKKAEYDVNPHTMKQQNVLSGNVRDIRCIPGSDSRRSPRASYQGFSKAFRRLLNLMQRTPNVMMQEDGSGIEVIFRNDRCVPVKLSYTIRRETKQLHITKGCKYEFWYGHLPDWYTSVPNKSVPLASTILQTIIEFCCNEPDTDRSEFGDFCSCFAKPGWLIARLHERNQRTKGKSARASKDGSGGKRSIMMKYERKNFSEVRKKTALSVEDSEIEQLWLLFSEAAAVMYHKNKGGCLTKHTELG